MNHHKRLIILASLFLAAFTPSCFSQRPQVSAEEKITPPANESPEHRFASDILSYINEYRSSKGLSSLASNTVIAEQAQLHSMNMATNNVAFSHDGFESRVKIISQQLGAITASAENVALGKLNAREVVDLWLNSAGHRKNIEGQFKLTGIGIATATNGTIYFTEIFTR